MNMFEKISAAISKAFTVLRDVLTKTNDLAKKYGPQLREFVISTADELEKAIPDSGFGNVKLMMFDGALKVFIEAMREQEEVPDKDMGAIYEFAHFLLEGYLASKKAYNTIK